MGSYHTVAQGEHVSSITAALGFWSYTTVWNHAKNVVLQRKRQNPNVLLPGDLLFIPDKQPQQIPAAIDRAHRFVLKRARLTLRLVVEDIYRQPIAHAPCTLQIDGADFPAVTDGQGQVEHDIPAGAKSAVLTIRDPQTPLHEQVIRVEIGHLDPVTEASGQSARLCNLGYLPRLSEAVDDADEAAMRDSAIQEFQCDQGLLVDGVCGPATQARLQAIHGC